MSTLACHGPSRTLEGGHEVAYLNSKRGALCDDARGDATAEIVFNKQLEVQSDVGEDERGHDGVS